MMKVLIRDWDYVGTIALTIIGCVGFTLPKAYMEPEKGPFVDYRPCKMGHMDFHVCLGRL